MAAAPGPEDSDLIFKVVVSGPYAAGKTTLITTIAQRSLVATESAVSDAGEAATKSSTTVGMDFGTFAIPDDEGRIELRLHGTPGQERFRFMWEILAEGADGMVILVDGRRPDSWTEAKTHIAVLRAVADAPGIVAVNHLDDDVVLDGHAVLDDVRACFAGSGLDVVRCDARDAGQVFEALLVVLAAALERLEEQEMTTTGADSWY